jgi:hypothetical protein
MGHSDLLKELQDSKTNNSLDVFSNNCINRFFESIIYLDTIEIERLFGGLTGLKGRPKRQVEGSQLELNAGITIPGLNVGGKKSGNTAVEYEISDSFLLEYLLRNLKLKEIYKTVILNQEDVIQNEGKFGVWLSGVFYNGEITKQNKQEYELKGNLDGRQLQGRLVNKGGSEDVAVGLYCHLSKDVDFFFPIDFNNYVSSYGLVHKKRKAFKENCITFGRYRKFISTWYFTPIFILDELKIKEVGSCLTPFG